MHWSHLFNLPQIWIFQISALIAQTTPSPTPSPTPKPSPSQGVDVELLTKQIEFLQNANERLNNSFENFVNAINLSFLVFTIILGIAGAVSVYFFNQSLREAKQMIREEVEKRLRLEVDQAVGERVQNLKQVLDREKIVGTINVDYYLPSAEPVVPDDYPEEYYLLLARNFKNTRFLDASKKTRFSGDVVVLDLVNYDLVADSEINQHSQEEISNLIETRVGEQLNKILRRLPREAVMVVYIRPGKKRISAIDELGKKVKYYASANTPISLMGVVVDSAYVAHASK